MNTQNRFAHASIFASLAAISTMILGAGLYMAGLYQSPLAWLGYVFLASAMAWGQVQWRNKVKGGAMGYGHAFGYGMLFSITYVVLSAIWMFVFLTFIAPDYMEKALSISEQQMIDKNLPQEQIDMAMRITRQFMTPGFMIAMVFIGGGIMSTIISLIVSAFTKKDPDPFLQQQAQEQQFYQNQQGWAQQQQQNPFQQNQPPQNPNQQPPQQ